MSNLESIYNLYVNLAKAHIEGNQDRLSTNYYHKVRVIG